MLGRVLVLRATRARQAGNRPSTPISRVTIAHVKGAVAKVDSMGGAVAGNSGTAAIVRTVTVAAAVAVAVVGAVVATILDRMEATKVGLKVGLLLLLLRLKVNRSLWKVG